uniref:Uncharacterized protein n=1 Tax=Glossina brevipalpis TaxID=37001 RepID=A0A1A9WS55_9MUSC
MLAHIPLYPTFNAGTGIVDVAFINNSVCGLVIESAVELVVAVIEFMFAVDDNNVKVAFSVVVVVVVVVVIFDDLGLFQSPKRVQAFFHLHWVHHISRRSIP